jgi:hypothetical protein
MGQIERDCTIKSRDSLTLLLVVLDKERQKVAAFLC